MSDLFWPGDHLAGDAMSAAAFLAAMLRVEQGWLDGLVTAGIAPPEARASLGQLVDVGDLEGLARGADVDGNPVSGLVALLRDRLPEPAARWVHRGLTSQDVLDTALMLCVGEVLERLAAQTTTQLDALSGLVEEYRDAPMLARTLTQPALPSTLGVKLAGWLSGLLDAADPLADMRAALPAQVGGAVGTLAAVVELAGSVQGALALADGLAEALHLRPALPWHTTRAPITRIGDLLAGCCDAYAHLGADVATGSRAEIGEFAEGHGGGSSTMAHKHNPVRAVLIRRTALTAGPLAATLHTAAGGSVDERADGAWHAEWATLATLARRTVVAAAHTSDLLTGLRIDTHRAAANLAAAGDLGAEQRTMTALTARQPHPTYLGAINHLIDTVLDRATRYRKDHP